MDDRSEKNIPDNSKYDVISVIDEFDYSTQGKKYNEQFIEWRKRKGNPFSFSFEKHIKESVYVDGRGFILSSATDAERESLARIFYILGSAALMYMVIDNVIGRLLIILLSQLGFDIHASLFSPAVYGGGTEIICVLMAVNLLKYIVPAAYLHFRFRLPPAVERMNSRHDTYGLVGAIGVTLIICSLLNLPSAYSNETKEIYSFFKELNTDVKVWNQTEFVIYAVFDIVIMSTLSEIFFRGAMFAVLRQFGDYFAVIMSTLTAVLLAQDLREVPAVLLMSLVCSVGMLSSGSIFTAVAASIVFRIYQLTLAMIETGSSYDMFLTRNIFMLSALLIGAVMLAAAGLMSRGRDHRILARSETGLAQKERITRSVMVFPYSAVAAICGVISIIKAVL